MVTVKQITPLFFTMISDDNHSTRFRFKDYQANIINIASIMMLLNVFVLNSVMHAVNVTTLAFATFLKSLFNSLVGITYTLFPLLGKYT